uniref:Uncharacterized protein n=1 Tax=Anguilla anguilla TaxID=7936 RepID=A0A0E9S8N5_ANGAN
MLPKATVDERAFYLTYLGALSPDQDSFTLQT